MLLEHLQTSWAYLAPIFEGIPGIALNIGYSDKII